jgi:predicted RNA methylase
MTFKNTTVQNRSKQQRLNNSHTIPNHYIEGSGISKFLAGLLEVKTSKQSLLYSIGIELLPNRTNPAIQRFLKEYKLDVIDIEDIPRDQFDLLGSVYQFLNSKLENLEKGSFYTGGEVARDFISDLNFSSGELILDPACGSGSFLFRSDAPASQIYGVDADPIAIMIAKFNYFQKFPNAEYPNLFCEDFFTWFSKNEDERFDYIIGNPPYGANLDLAKIPTQYIESGESFSYFIEFGYWLLKQNGIFRYLLPEAILNVKRHTDVRNFILQKTNLKRIKKYSKKFTGVMSDVYMIELNHERTESVIFEDGGKTLIPKSIFAKLKNSIFVNLNETDIGIIEKVERLKGSDLSQSIFGLGVVTGDNKTKLFPTQLDGMEAIYTGKEVEKYTLLSPRNYLMFDRDNLQQVAPDEIYRAPVKLVYQTISKYLKVAIDTTGSLTSNSANIIIPKIPELDPYIILGFLNSDLYTYLHLKLFGGVNKIAKENLMALPFPRVTDEQNVKLKECVLRTLDSGNDDELQLYINNEIFSLTEIEVAHIASAIE